MAFRMIDPVMVHKKKRRPESSKEVLRRIESYLNGNFEEPIRILHNMWEHQSDTIGYQELRQIVMDGTIGYEILRTWAEDYSKLVDTHIKSLWKDAMQTGRYGQPVLDQIDFGINFQNQRVQQWIGERGAQLVTNCVDTQIESIKTLMTEKMRQMYTPDHIARMIRPCIGLTAQQTNAVKNHYNTMVGTLHESHPKMKLENVYRKAEEASMKYAERLHRLRAQTIVQTESAFAYNKGADEAIRQAQEQNLIGECVKRWCTSGDARVCQMCAELDGTEIAMDDDFKIKGKAKFEGMHMLPPAHPRCACAVEYIENEIKTSNGMRRSKDDDERLYENEEYNGIPKTWEKLGEDSDILDVNPLNDNENCVNCTIAYEMRKRGYNVFAGQKIKRLANNPFAGWVNPDIKKLPENVSVFETISRELKKAGNGARFQIAIKQNKRYGGIWNNSKIIGHSYIAELMENEIMFIDVQRGVLYTKDEVDDVMEALYCRIDNIEINDIGSTACKKG